MTAGWGSAVGVQATYSAKLTQNLNVDKDAASEYGIVGWIAALAATDGPNGWHPHLHVLTMLAG